MTVVAGVDDSPVSELVIARAIQQARWRETDLHVVHVTSFPMMYTEVAIDWDEVAKAHRTAVWDRLEDVLAGSDVPVRRVDLEGHPPDMLVAYAGEQGASLLVVGTRGRGDFAALILGSTSHRVILLFDSDVLVVKAPEDRE